MRLYISFYIYIYRMSNLRTNIDGAEWWDVQYLKMIT